MMTLTATPLRSCLDSASTNDWTSGFGLYASLLPNAPRYKEPPRKNRPKPAFEPSFPATRPQAKAQAEKIVHIRFFGDHLELRDNFVVVKASNHGASHQLKPEPDASARPHVRVQPRPRPLTAEKMAKMLASRKAFAKHKEHREYLTRVSTGEHAQISAETAARAMKVWNAIWIASGGRMPIPAACTGPDGEMFYSWDRGRHHLELEIIPGKPAEFFYRDRETEQLWDEDYNIGNPLSADAREKLRLFR